MDENNLPPEDKACVKFEKALQDAIDTFFKENPGEEDSLTYMFCALFYCLTDEKHEISDYECLGQLENAKTIINHEMITKRQYPPDILDDEFGNNFDSDIQ